MTKEEAIKHLQNMADHSYPNEEYMIAIKALKQEPCDDAINREDTLKAMIEKLGIRNEDYLLPAEATLYKVVKNMPPVTPQPKTGHWISFGVQGEVDGQIVQVFTCSECGAISIFRMASGNIVNGDICPNCGAKMKSETEQGLSYADQDTLMSAT